MDKNDRFGLCRNSRRDLMRIYRARGWLNIDEANFRPDAQHRCCGCRRAHGWNEDMIVEADTQRLQSQNERVGAGANSHAMWRSEIRCEFVFEPVMLRPNDKGIPAKHGVYCGGNRGCVPGDLQLWRCL